MAITERTRPYETLIRHNDDGTIGAHHVTINEVMKDGTVIAAALNPPEPVSGAGLSAVLGEALGVALAQVDRANAAINVLTQANTEKGAEAVAAVQRIAELEAQVAELEAASATPA